jgi:hypothetical protein
MNLSINLAALLCVIRLSEYDWQMSLELKMSTNLFDTALPYQPLDPTIHSRRPFLP